MADWTFEPVYPGRIDPGDPPTVITNYDDGGSQRRERFSTTKRVWREKYVLTASEMDSLLDFWDARRYVTPFTRLTYDPREPALTEASVYFSRRPQFSQTSADAFEVQIEHREA